MKHLRVVTSLGVVLAVIAVGCGGDSDKPVVGISQLVPATALDETVKGLEQGLAERGYVPGEDVEIDIKNAQGEIPLTQSIAQELVADNVSVLAAVTTPSAQAAAKAIQGTEVPMVFASVTDPVAGGFLDSLDEPSGTNITGVYNGDFVRLQMDLVKQLMPDLQSLGVLYNTGEANSVATVESLQEIADENGWRLEKKTVPTSADALAAAESLVGNVDALYMPPDNTVNSALGSLIKVQREHKLPLFTADRQSVAKGAIATVGFDNIALGKQAAALVAKVLDGANAGELPPERIANRTTYLNPAAAAEVGIEIPADVRERAVVDS